MKNIHENCKRCQQTTLYTHYQVLQKKFTFTNKSSASHYRPFFFHIIPFSHIHTYTQKFMSYAINLVVWLHQNVTHWTAFSLDFPVAQQQDSSAPLLSIPVKFASSNFLAHCFISALLELITSGFRITICLSKTNSLKFGYLFSNRQFMCAGCHTHLTLGGSCEMTSDFSLRIMS